MSWHFYTAVSVISLSLSVLLQRVLLHRDKINPYAYVVIFQAIVGALLMVPAIINGFGLPNITDVMAPAIVSILAFAAGHIAYAKTLQRVEASVFSVLFATQAIWIMLLGIFLFNESLKIVQIFGVALIFGSVLLLVEKWRTLRLDAGTSLGLFTGLLFGIAIISWSYVGRYTDGISWAAASFLGTGVVAYLVHPPKRQDVRKLLAIRRMPKLVLLGALYGLGSLMMLYAYRAGTFAEVTPIRQTSIIVTTLLAVLLLSGERNRVVAKMIAALLCFAGVILVLV
jgi:drug/metabolite transporter (DMT)-like permease